MFDKFFKFFILCLFLICFPFVSNASYKSETLSEEPKINAKHAIVFDRNSEQVLYDKNSNESCKMASTTKIMTAIITIEKANLKDIVSISSKSASTGGSRLGLSKEDTVSVEHLLYGLMLKSGNDAAVALAEHVARKC